MAGIIIILNMHPCLNLPSIILTVLYRCLRAFPDQEVTTTVPIQCHTYCNQGDKNSLFLLPFCGYASLSTPLIFALLKVILIIWVS